MIAFLRGTVQSVEKESVLVDVNGVGYRVSVPVRILDEIGQVGQEVFLHTHLHVTDGSQSLFGLKLLQELRLFELLTNVNGVGPRYALRLLSVLSPDELINAIITEDVAMLTRAPGVGRKTAARISLEIKGVLVEDWGAVSATSSGVDSSVIEALVALGYSQSEARNTLVGLGENEDLTLEQKIAMALQALGR